MGKASSAKKVARLTAGTSKQARQRRAKYGFPAIVGSLLVVGVLGIVLLRSGQPSAFPHASSTGVAGQGGGDHIHEAYGMYVCGAWLPVLPQFESQLGIHTHGDGIIHIHPFDITASGRHAQLKVFLNGAGVQLSNTKLVVPKTDTNDAVSVKDGGKCNGKPATLRVAEWTNAVNRKTDKAVTTGPTKIYTSGFGNIWLGHDGGALTIFYGPADAKIPLPTQGDTIANLVAAFGGVDQSGGTGSSGASGASGTSGASSTTGTSGATGGSGASGGSGTSG